MKPRQAIAAPPLRRAILAPLLAGSCMFAAGQTPPIADEDSTQATAAAAQPAPDVWTATLSNGGVVRVDPRTNRPTVTRNGQQVQLWDGVHRLADGRELTVRNGRVVPNQEMVEQREAVPMPPPSAGGVTAPLPSISPCVELVLRTCGAHDACASTEQCSASRQLHDMAERLLGPRGDPAAARDAVAKCREALGDDFFSPCTAGDHAAGGR